MHPLEKYEKAVLSVIRMDLQLHFFWSFTLTVLAVFWSPLLYAGIIVTLVKESLDLAAQKGWSWGDVIWGIAGWIAALVFLKLINFY